jgi:hypothetical protein
VPGASLDGDNAMGAALQLNGYTPWVLRDTPEERES